MDKIKKYTHDGHRKRLREKFISGKESFKEHELLELLLGYSIPRKDTNELAHTLIDKFGSLKKVLTGDVQLLKTIDGVGEKTATFLSLIGYVSKVYEKDENSKIPISSIEEAKTQLVKLFKDYDHEVFFALYLNLKNKVVGFTKIDNNNENSVNIDFSELSKGILIHNPASIIVAHNHLSKYPKPSFEDDVATEKIFSLLQLHKVNFYDHLIVSGKEIYSYFYDNRLQLIKNKVKGLGDA